MTGAPAGPERSLGWGSRETRTPLFSSLAQTKGMVRRVTSGGLTSCTSLGQPSLATTGSMSLLGIISPLDRRPICLYVLVKGRS